MATNDVANGADAGIPESATPAASSTWQVAKSRNVACYLVGNGFSTVGTWAYNVAAAVLVFRLTGSTFLVGTVTFAQFVGTLLLAPWAGPAADRFNRRKLLTVMQFAAVLPIAVLTAGLYVGEAGVWLVLATTGALGLVTGFSSPAQQAMVPLLVKPEDLESAVALSAMTFQLGRAIGPLVAAVVITSWGLPAAIGMNAVSFVVFGVLLQTVRLRDQEKVVGERTRFRATAASAWGDLRIRLLLLTLIALSVSADPITTLAPEYVTRVLASSDTGAGVLIGGFGVGSVLTAILLIKRLAERPNGLAVALGAQALGLLLFALAPSLTVALVGAVVTGGGFIGGMTQATSRLNKLAPPQALGRYMALWGIAFLGVRPFASLLDGAIAGIIGIRAAALVLAAPVIAAAVLVVRALGGSATSVTRGVTAACRIERRRGADA